MATSDRGIDLTRGLRDVPGPERAWLTGAGGEERVALELEKHVDDGVVLLHDRRLPGEPGNVDHIAVARSGVWVIDATRSHGRVRVARRPFRPARLVVADSDGSELVARLARQVEGMTALMASLQLKAPVRGALCFIDAHVWHTTSTAGFVVTGPRRLAWRINEKGPLVWPELPGIGSALAARLPLA